MGKYIPLSVMDLFGVIEVFNEKTGEPEKVKDVIENKYNEILEYINLTSMSGEINIKLKISQKNPEQVSVLADVSTKLKKIKNEVSLEQGEDGKIFLDNPDKQVLSGVFPVGTSEEQE
jgi:hypothetical protein